jgi:hypothetical protein
MVFLLPRSSSWLERLYTEVNNVEGLRSSLHHTGRVDSHQLQAIDQCTPHYRRCRQQVALFCFVGFREDMVF